MPINLSDLYNIWCYQRRYNKDPTTKPGTLINLLVCLAQLRLPVVHFLGIIVLLQGHSQHQSENNGLGSLY